MKLDISTKDIITIITTFVAIINHKIFQGSLQTYMKWSIMLKFFSTIVHQAKVNNLHLILPYISSSRYLHILIYPYLPLDRSIYVSIDVYI